MNRIESLEFHKKEYKRIIALNNDELLKEFETLIQNGAGEGYFPRIWIRKEILKRMREE